MKRIITFYRQLLYPARFWILAITGLAGVWAGVGFMAALSRPDTFPMVVRQLHEVFRRLLGDIEHQTRGQLVFVLFRQNVTSAFSQLFLGAIGGLLPVVSIAVNFFALGFLAAPGFRPQLFPGFPGSIKIFVLAVAPHGVFELPALIIAAAFGLRLGWMWLLPAAFGRRWIVFRQTLLDAVLVVPLVVALLAIAAVVEVFVSSQLIR